MHKNKNPYNTEFCAVWVLRSKKSYLFFTEAIDGTDQSKNRSRDNIFMNSCAPCNVAVWLLDTDISTCLGIGSYVQRMFLIGHNRIVHIAMSLKSVADSV